MIYGINPIVSTIEEYDNYNTKEKSINLAQNEFTMAFAVRNYLDGEYKQDPSFVRWQARIFESDGKSDISTVQ